jgi:peptide/nickel transport system substrate-binding protein
MDEQRFFTRREFLKFSVMSVLGALAVGCDRQGDKATPAPKAGATEPPPALPKLQESPLLAELAQAKKLPPIAQRLPTEPLVVRPLEKIGRYGGMLRTLADPNSSGAFGVMLLGMACYETLLRLSQDYVTIEPNILRAWEVSRDGQSYTLHFRRGLKWSDGQPCTAEDVRFVFEEVRGNEDVMPGSGGARGLGVGGEYDKVEKVDDYTLRIHFIAPNVFLPYYLSGYEYHILPKHYLSKYHPNYTARAELEKQAKAEGLGYRLITSLFEIKYNLYGGNPDCPTLRAWKLTTRAPSQEYLYERNPYYWKVDSEGNQLPYIDRAKINVLGTARIPTEAAAGTADLQQWGLDVASLPMLREKAQSAGYRTLLWQNPQGAVLTLWFNQNAADVGLRALIQDDRLRIALSHAIDRAKINEQLFSGLGEARQATASTGALFFKPEYARAHADYSPEKADGLLNELELTERDAEGFRKRPNGELFWLTIEAEDESDATARQLAFIQEDWQKVGVKTILRMQRGSYSYSLTQRLQSGQASVAAAGGLLLYHPHRLAIFAPITETTWAPAFGKWHKTGGKEGEEPPADIRALQLAWERLQKTLDEQEQIKICQEILDLHAKHCWLIGWVGHVPYPIVANSNLRNLPERAVCASEMGYLGAARLEQLYFEE